MKFELGKEGKDKITGFTGILTGCATYLTGCDQYILQPKCDAKKLKDYPDGKWIDEGRIELTGAELKENVKAKKNGCDYVAPMK